MTDMIAGKLMPQPVSVLSTVLSITFIGRGRKFNPAVLDIFRVRRDNVAEALLWLKENNPKYYGNINIDSSRLNELPVNDVPDEIKINMRQEEYPAFITTESEGYVSGNNIYEEAGDISSLPLEDEHTCDNPDVVPLQYLGAMDNEGTKITSRDILECGLANLLKQSSNSEMYAISAFSIQQRRQALMSAKLLTQRKDFPTVERIMREISLQELQKAAEEECMGLKPSNPSIRLLEGKATAVAKRVIGSNAARAQLRSQIISTSLLLNQPALWLTINPDDYNDPIAQIYAGAEIDMDNFSLTSAPSPTKRAQNIAGDPFAAAQFFNFTIKTILEKLFGIVATTTRVHSSMGVLGRVQAYFGTVECQGRGTLHLHMLLWLEGSPPPCEMKERLQTEEFRLKMATYLQANVRTYLSELHSPEHLKKIPVNPHVAYSRLPNPSKPPDQLYAELRQLEVAVARSKQMHKCDDSVCKRYDKYGHEYCKRRAPWELSEHDTVCSDGTYRTRRTLGYLNGYCPWIAVATKSNHDIKFCSYGSKATGIAFYCTKYMVKGEGRSHNTSSLLAKGLVYYYEETPRNTQLQNNRDDLIWKAFNILNREQEVPAPLVVTHLMGWGDVYKSHQYATIFWMSFVSVIHKFYPQLRWNREESGNTDPPKDSSGPSAENIDSEHLGERNTSRMVHDEEETIVLQFDKRTRNVIDNIEHYHVCKTAAEGGQEAANIVEESQLIDEDIDMEMDEMLDNNTTYSSSMITAEMVAEEKSKALNNREMAHGLQAVRIGEAKHIFRTSKMNVIQQRANKGSSEDIEALKEWKLLLDRAKKLPLASAMENTSSSVVGGRGNADIMPIELIGSIVPLQLPRVEAIQGPLQEQSLPSLGAGGTGKSRVIQTITNEFKRRGCEEKLLKSAYTGIAASLIDGKTTHHIASISVGDSKKVLSVDAKKKLGILWKEVDYLVVDECSMLSKPFLAQLSRNIATAKMEFNQAVGHLPFGGVNIILCGDLHQFPPVAGASKCALYHPVDLKRDQTNTDSQYGRATYEKFETVVALKEQVRVTDPVWQAFLDRLRHGRVKDEDVAMLKELTLTNTQCCPTDFSSPKWENCCLITPRHAVRNQWNYAAVTQHCQNSAAQLYISPANDTVSGKKGRRPLALHEQFVAAKSKCDSRGIGAKNGLPDEVLLAIGLKVMVTLNIETDLDIANGARGTICDIVLSPSEPPIDPDEPVVTLREPPAYILVQLDRTRALELPGLQKGVVPIVPATKSYRISIPVLQPTGEVKVISRTVRRQQLPITPAYAFTDYRSQGQTIPAAIVDIATPPTGSGLTLANIYVALSRSSGSDSIRILREFDESIFMKPVDYDLVKEDERLELLDQQTMNWWESLNGNK
ncbi:DNA repair and recombination protein pif1,mitochondrial [Rhizoctonia solani AG-1 IB]|uniref:ATP-dependent DNA helicase n=1 Tax=Thanatephorus cucumeris (strain AG1-IB / isolate 7/3/14) TaxID=1108050 RepID=M5C6M7_THACB|nr:DNA repair and recombination protein pif1,mitochondrial [Rhizoctonia solani AG-1 IB]